MAPDLVTNLITAISIAKRRMRYVVIPFCLVVTVGLVGVVLLPRGYVSDAKILIDAPQLRSVTIGAESASSDSLADWIEGVQQRVTSRQRLLDLADRFDLFPAARARLRDLPENDRAAAAAHIAENVRSKIQMRSVSTNSPGGRRVSLPFVLAISFEYENAQIAAQVVSALVTMIQNEDERARRSRASESVRFLEKEAARVQQRLTDVEAEIAAFSSQHRETLPDRIEYQIAELRAGQSRVDKLDADARSMDDQARMLDFEMRVKLAATEKKASDSVADRLRSLRADLARKEAIYASAHPLLKAARQELAALEDEARQAAQAADRLQSDARPSLDDAIKAASPDVSIIVEKLKAIALHKQELAKQRVRAMAEIATLRGLIVQIPQVKSELAAIERRRATIQAAYDEAARKLAASRTGEEAEHLQEIERFDVIEPPVPAEYPAGPQRKKYAALILLFAVAAAAACAATREYYSTIMAKLGHPRQSPTSEHEHVESSLVPTLPSRQTRQGVAFRPLSACLILAVTPLSSASIQTQRSQNQPPSMTLQDVEHKASESPAGSLRIDLPLADPLPAANLKP